MYIWCCDKLVINTTPFCILILLIEGNTQSIHKKMSSYMKYK